MQECGWGLDKSLVERNHPVASCLLGKDAVSEEGSRFRIRWLELWFRGSSLWIWNPFLGLLGRSSTIYMEFSAPPSLDLVPC